MVMIMKDDIYTLAHEIRNPLSVVKGYLEMINTNNLEKYKRIIQNEVDVSLNVLTDYLNYDKIGIIKEEIDLNVLLLDIKNSFKEYLKCNNIKLYLNTIDDEIYLKADYNKLKQVFYNILKNSIEAKSHCIIISYHVMFNRVIICIKNDGIKMDEESLIKIGDYFTNKSNGNGIGMSISKKIIEMHRGKIKFRNNKKMGISTYITLNLS